MCHQWRGDWRNGTWIEICSIFHSEVEEKLYKNQKLFIYFYIYYNCELFLCVFKTFMEMTEEMEHK